MELKMAKGKYPGLQIAGHECTIEFIKAEPADRYGWKDDHLVVWVKFTPEVCSVISTGVEIPIREYDENTLLATIQDAIGDKIKQIEKEDETKRSLQIKENAKISELNSIAESISNILKIK